MGAKVEVSPEYAANTRKIAEYVAAAPVWNSELRNGTGKVFTNGEVPASSILNGKVVADVSVNKLIEEAFSK